jgi:carbon storage regulator
MLVLKRKPGERIILDNGVVITLVRLDNGSARIGVDAPGVAVHREEVYNAIHADDLGQRGEGT